MTRSNKFTLIAGALLATAISGAAPAPVSDLGRSRVLYADPVLHVPKASQTLQVTVQSSVSFDPITAVYTYAYEVTNEAGSASALHSFGLGPIPTALSLGIPPHWDGGQPWEGDSTVAGWTVADNDTSALPADDTGNVYQSPYDLSTGQTLLGFTLRSRKPPTTIQFFAQGFDTLPTGDSDLPPPALSQEGVTGNITGPDINAVLGVGPQELPEGGIAFRPPAPNPARGAVSLVFELPERSRIVLNVIDVRGRRVRALAQGFRERGIHTVTWNGRGDDGAQVAAGIYFIRLGVDGKPVGRRRVVLVR